MEEWTKEQYEAEIERLTKELNLYKTIYESLYKTVNVVIDDIQSRLQDLKKC